jgi:pimeloyl-ACP methyl ester carboxylesterase
LPGDVNHVLKLARRIFLGLIALTAVAVACGSAYQAAMEARDDRKYPAPGKLVDVDGHRMHIFCQGQGSPTIIVEQGLGAQSLAWAPINERMSGISTVCAYDRVGMGYSDPVGHVTPAEEVARNLNGLLQNAGIADDLVLVGWSAGGMYVREYYRQFPVRVKAMVLVDSTHEHQIQRMGEPANAGSNPLRFDPYLARVGWFRITGQMQERFADSALPAPIRDRLIAINLKSHMPRTWIAEGDGLRADLLAGRSPPNLGSLPLIVLSEGRPDVPFMQERLQTWLELHEELARLSTNGRRIVATQSAHFIHLTEPDLIVDLVAQVVSAVREAR